MGEDDVLVNSYWEYIMAQRNIKKTNTILAILLVVQLALVIYVFRPTPQGTLEGGFLLDVLAESITGITITDNENQSIALAKNSDGWAIEPAEQKLAPLPADMDKVDTLLTKIGALSRNRVVTRTQASHNRLKVGQLYNRKIELSIGEDKKILFLGSSPNYKSLHVRLDGEDEVYLDKDLSIWEAPTAKESWWRTDYMALDPEALTAVELTNSNEKIMLQKDAEGIWQLEGMTTEAELSQEPLESLLNDLAHLTILEYMPADFKPASDDTIASVKLTTAQDIINLSISPKDEEKEDHLVKSSRIAFYAKAGIHAVKDILEIQANELIQPKAKEDAPVQENSNPSPQ